MASTALVDSQIKDGEEIIRQLDADEFPVASALWFYDSDKEKWILIIASPLVSSLGPKKSYDKIRESLDKLAGQLTTQSLAVTLTKPEHDLLQLLKSAITIAPGGISRVRFTGNVINGTLIDDALIYRLS